MCYENLLFYICYGKIRGDMSWRRAFRGRLAHTIADNDDTTLRRHGGTKASSLIAIREKVVAEPVAKTSSE